MTRRSVLFPEPLGPSTVTTSPSATSSVTPSSAGLPSKLDAHVLDPEHQNQAAVRSRRRRSMTRIETGGDDHQDHRQRVRLTRRSAPRGDRGSGRSRPEASGCPAGRGRPSRRTRRARSRTRSRPRLPAPGRRRGGRSRGAPVPGTRRAPRLPRAAARRSRAASARRCGRRTGSRRAPARRERSTARSGSRSARCRRR